jgi:tetratricopeptide (TPR) repeat protein
MGRVTIMVTDSAARCRVVGTPVSYGLEMFKDRRTQQEQILQWLADPLTRMVTVFGRRGIGKSSLAAKVVGTLASTDSGYRGVVNLSTRTDGAFTIERIFFACAELASPATKEELSALWASRSQSRDKLVELFAALGDGRRVVVLDNLEDQLSDDGRPGTRDLEIFFDVVFRAAHAPRVLATTQVPVALDPAMRRMEARLDLKDGLPVAECVELLRELDRNGEAGLLDAPRAELELAARQLHGVPRALELTVGALVDDQLTLPSLDDLLKDFPARGDIVDQLAHDRYRRLDEEARMTLDVLAVFGSPVTREPVQWVIQPLAPGLDPARALSQLAHVHMISVDRRSREFGLHPLDADIAYAALPPDGPFSRRVLERRVAAWFESTRCQPPWRSVADVSNHRLAYEHRLRAGDYDECAFILDDISEFLVLRGSIREVTGMHLAIRDHLSDDAAVLADLVGYGQARHIGGPLDVAIEPLQRAVALAERLKDLPHLERALFSLGDVFRGLRRLREAIEALTRAAAVAGQIGNVEHQAHALLGLSLSHTYLGEVPEALALADRLSRLAEETGEPIILGRAGDARSAAHIAAGPESVNLSGAPVGGYY